MEREGTGAATVRTLQAGDAASLTRFAEAYPYKPYYYLSGVSEERLTRYFHAELSGRLDRGEAFGWTAGDDLLGIVIFDDLPWDTRIFGLQMGKIDLYVRGSDHRETSSIVSSLIARVAAVRDEKKVRHLSCKLDARDTPTIHAVESHAFRLVDTIAVYALRPDQISAPGSPTETQLRVREMAKDDLPRLSTLARAAFTDRSAILTRFSSDPLLARNAGEMYSQWLGNSYRGEQADIVFVAEADRGPIGFITCRLSSEWEHRELGTKVGSVPLNAVDPDYRGRGVYRQLVLRAMDWFGQHGAEHVETKTQLHTLAVHRTWQQLNGRLVHSYHVFHQWRDT